MTTTDNFKVTREIPQQRVEDLLCCAFEGGSGYWCCILDYENPDNVEVTYKHTQLPLTERGAVICVESNDFPPESEENQRWRLDREAVARGLQLMAEKYPNHFGDFANENEDAITGDVFLQLALFGELVYG